MLNRQNVDRRKPDRRIFTGEQFDGPDRRSVSRRDYLDRRSNEAWRFSWLRVTLTHQLAA